MIDSYDPFVNYEQRVLVCVSCLASASPRDNYYDFFEILTEKS